MFYEIIIVGDLENFKHKIHQELLNKICIKCIFFMHYVVII